ncbi:MAG: sugar-binding domain-containing protein, partial [Tepidisphaeraceae bacterium]
MKVCVALAILFLCRALWAAEVESPTGQDGWKPARTGGAMMTRWAKDVSPDKVHPEYPRPQMVRKEWKNLNGLWQFASADEVKDAPVGKDLPGQILVPFCMESALSGVGRHHDKSWYRRLFDVPGEWKDKRVLLHFGAVDYESTVWINGKRVNYHEDGHTSSGGYHAFEIDITDMLQTGKPQEIVVSVTDATSESQARGKQTTKPEGIWYTPVSGIWQTVWIEPVPKDYVSRIIITPDVDAASVTVKAVGTLHTSPEFKITVRDKGKIVATGQGLSDRGCVVKIPDPHLWSPDDPFLYDLQLQTAGGDTIESYFGMRKIEVSPDEKGIPRIKLNGKEIMQIGPLDQGWWPDGLYTAPTDEALKSDIEFAKKVGFNMLRKHVKVEPQRFYYHCDKLGILVWQDMPNVLAFEAGEWQKQFEIELKALVEQHINSPSIIMRVPLNEGWGQDARKKPDGTLGAAPYDKAGTIALADKVKQWDPTRLVNNASGWTDSGGGDVYDIHSYPGPAAPPIEKKRAIVLGEFGGLGLPIEGHLWQTDKNWGYQNMASKEELTERYVRLLGRLWQLHDENGLCAGVYTQTTDVEGEVNGLLTYDRALVKLDAARIREANLGKGPRIDIVPLVKTAQEAPADWKYTTDKPGDGWMKPDFDDSSWKTGQSGFGTKETPGAIVNTTWNTPDIWLRREVELSAEDLSGAELIWHHDERAEVFINGVLATRSGQHTTSYVEQKMKDEAKKALKAGKNNVAVHCAQT